MRTTTATVVKVYDREIQNPILWGKHRQYYRLKTQRWAILKISHSLYDEDCPMNDVLVHNVTTRGNWPVASFTYPNQSLPPDVKEGDKIEIAFSYAGYYRVVSPKWGVIRDRE